MTIESYLAFLAASIVVLVIPGPTIMLVVSCSLTQGRRAALPLALGVGLGDLTAMTASLAGLGALLAVRARKAVASTRAMTMVHRAGGTALIGAGLLTATLRRTQE